MLLDSHKAGGLPNPVMIFNRVETIMMKFTFDLKVN